MRNLIYLAFISLGLPDSIMGVSWPSMRTEWGLEIDALGLVSIVGLISAVLSTFYSGKIISFLGTGKTVVFSILLTSIGLFGISVALNFIFVLILTIPLFVGSGALDTALNNYVAINYGAKHMSWLHSFWGIGATLGPIVVSYAIIGRSWRAGYSSLSMIQFAIFVLLILSLPLWKQGKNEEVKEQKDKTYKSIIIIRGVKTSVLIFFVYC